MLRCFSEEFRHIILERALEIAHLTCVWGPQLTLIQILGFTVSSSILLKSLSKKLEATPKWQMKLAEYANRAAHHCADTLLQCPVLNITADGKLIQRREKATAALGD